MADSRIVKVRAFGNEFLSGEWLLFTEMQLSICRDEEFRQAEKEKREKRPPLKGTVKLSSLAAFSPPAATAKSLILSL